MSLLWLAETSTIPRTMGALGIIWHSTFSFFFPWSHGSFIPCPDQNSSRGPGNPVGFSELYLCAATFSVNVVQLFSHSAVSDSLCPTDYSTPGFPVLPHLPELAQIHVHRSSRWCHPIISSSVVHFSSCLQSFPTSGPFSMSWLFASGGQSICASALASSFQWIFRVDFL